MSWFDGMRNRLRSVLRPAEYSRELDEEMRFHKELDELNRTNAHGSRRRFGSVTRYLEETRDLTWLGRLDPIRQDLAYACRSIARAPTFTMLLVFTFAIGLGANASIFTLLDQLFLRPPEGVAEPGSLRRIWITHYNADEPFTAEATSYPQSRRLAAAVGDSTRLTVFVSREMPLGASRFDPKAQVTYATANYFPVLGVVAARGRVFNAEEDRLGSGTPVVVISHGFWQRQLNGDASVLGRTLSLSSAKYTIVGVLPATFRGTELQATELWVPISTIAGPGERWWEEEASFRYKALMRMPPRLSDSLFARRATALIRIPPATASGMKHDSLMTVATGPIITARGPGTAEASTRITTRIGGAAAIILLIACANVINLLLARAVSRRREIALRLALGISRARLVRLIALEAIVLAAVAAVPAMLIALFGGELLRSLLFPRIEWLDGALHWRVVIYTLGIALAAGALAGIVPALQATKPDLAKAMKAGSRELGMHRSGLRRGLVIAQAALSVVLLVGAGLLIRSLQEIHALDIGFDPARTLIGEAQFDDAQEPPPVVLAAALREVSARLEGRPGIEAVGRANLQPMQGHTLMRFYIDGDSAQSFSKQWPSILFVTPGYFRAAGLRMLRGTGLSGGDVERGPREIVVNQAAAALLWPGKDAIGQCMRFVSATEECYAVSGVVENSRQRQLIENEPVAQLYAPLGHQPHGNENAGIAIVVRSAAGAEAMATREVETAIRQVLPAAHPAVTPMLKTLDRHFQKYRLGATLFGACSALALLVSMIGIYSSMSYAVSQRTNELGIRAALGARLSDQLRLVAGEGLGLTAVGVLIGNMFALAGGRLIESLLYGVTPSNPGVLLAVGAGMMATAMIALVSPVWRAGRVDPAVALRAQ